MSTLRDAAEQARTALNWAADHIPPQLDHCQCPVCLALDALEKALAQQEQATSKESLQVGQEEPVAMRYDYDGHGYLYIDSGSGSDWQTRHKDAEPLYTRPPRREWRSLSEEEIDGIGKRLNAMTGINLTGYARKVGRGMSNIPIPRATVQQALEALEICAVRQEHQWHGLQQVQIAKSALRDALAQPNADYERGFIDGMSEQAKRSVDRAVNRISQEAGE
jgi:hypothetical protein